MTTRVINSLGIAQYVGPRDVDLGIPYTVQTAGPERILICDWNYANLPGPSETDAGIDYIPANSLITRAYTFASEDFTIGSADTIDIGFEQADGTDIDLDGIDATVAASALDENDWIVNNGALIGATVGTANAYLRIKGTSSDANITAGRAQQLIYYIPPTGA